MFLKPETPEHCQRLTESDMRSIWDRFLHSHRKDQLCQLLRSVNVYPPELQRQHISVVWHPGLWITEALANEYAPQGKNLTMSENQAAYTDNWQACPKRNKGFLTYLDFKIYTDLNII